MISKESFQIQNCSSCGFHFTNPIPTKETIGAYYKSEDYVSHSSSSKGIINFLYGKVRNYTLKAKVKLIRSFSTGQNLLDIGAGTGHFLNTAQKNGFSVEGLEPDSDAVAFANKEFGVKLKSLETLYTLDSESKDLITMWHVLEHVYDLRTDLAEISRVLKKDGFLFVAVPNMDSFDAKHYAEFWAAYDVPRHLYHFQKNTIETLLNQFSFDLVKVLPMKFDSYYVSMLSEKYKKGSLLKAAWIGFLSNRRGKKQGFSSQIYVYKKK